MNLKELFKLEVGSKVRLKGTNVIFEILSLDESDPDRPLEVKMLSEPERPVVNNILAGYINSIECDVAVWVYNNKAALAKDRQYTRSEIDYATRIYDVLTVRNLETYEEPSNEETKDVKPTKEFALGELVTIPGSNAIFKIIEVDEEYERMRYKVRIIYTDKEVMYNLNGLYYTTGMYLWIYNSRSMTDFVDGDDSVYQLTADVLVSAETASEGFAVGDIVTIPGMNATFEIVRCDPDDESQPYRVKILESDKPIYYRPGGAEYFVGECTWVRAKQQNRSDFDDSYVLASDLFVLVQPTTLPDIQKIREITKANSMPEKLKVIGEQISQAANRGISYCEVDDVDELNDHVIEKLETAGYIVCGNRISW